MAPLLWTLKQNMGPSERAACAMVYGAARKRTVLFGGYSEPAFDIVRSGDTWQWDGEYTVVWPLRVVVQA